MIYTEEIEPGIPIHSVSYFVLYCFIWFIYHMQPSGYGVLLVVLDSSEKRIMTRFHLRS